MFRFLFAFVVALVLGFFAAGATAAQTPGAGEPTLRGDLPILGGFGLAVWSGGSLDAMRVSAQTQGCALQAVWVTRQGDFVGHIFGAPAVVSQSTGSSIGFPGGEASAGTPLIVVCAVVTAPAPIESVEIHNPLGSWSARVVSGLPSGCVQFHSYEAIRQGDTITIRVLNRVPAPDARLACTAIYGMVTSDIVLPGPFVSGRTYTVLVNDQTATFAVP
jgi:hypothetical protein